MDDVRVGPVIKCLALVAVVLCLGTGCGGLATTQTISPLMFFLPGLGDARPSSPQIVPLVKNGLPTQLVASNRELAEEN